MAHKRNVRPLRYMETNDKTWARIFTLSDYSTGPSYVYSIFSRPLDERPQWLVNIVNIGIVGGHTLPYRTPDQEGFVLWFDVTPKANKLVRFHDFDCD